MSKYNNGRNKCRKQLYKTKLSFTRHPCCSSVAAIYYDELYDIHYNNIVRIVLYGRYNLRIIIMIIDYRIDGFIIVNTTHIAAQYLSTRDCAECVKKISIK